MTSKQKARKRIKAILKYPIFTAHNSQTYEPNLLESAIFLYFPHWVGNYILQKKEKYVKQDVINIINKKKSCLL